MGVAHSFVFFFVTFFFGRFGWNAYLRWIYSVIHLVYLCAAPYLCKAGRKRKRALQGCNPSGIYPAIEASSFFDNGAKKIASFADKGGYNGDREFGLVLSSGSAYAAFPIFHAEAFSG